MVWSMDRTINPQLLSCIQSQVYFKLILVRVAVYLEPIPGTVGTRQGHPKWDAGLLQSTRRT